MLPCVTTMLSVMVTSPRANPCPYWSTGKYWESPDHGSSQSRSLITVAYDLQCRYITPILILTTVFVFSNTLVLRSDICTGIVSPRFDYRISSTAEQPAENLSEAEHGKREGPMEEATASSPPSAGMRCARFSPVGSTGSPGRSQHKQTDSTTSANRPHP